MTAPRERLNLALVAFPLLTAIRLTPMLEVVCLGLLLVLALIGKPLADDTAARYVPVALLVGVCGSLTFLRGGPLIQGVLLVAAALAASLAARRTDAATGIRSLAAGIGVYMFANVAGWAAGIVSPAAAVRVGLTEGRIIFPFTRSINEPAILAVGLIVFVALSWRLRRSVPLLASTGVLPAAFVVVASGSRLPAIVLALALAVVVVAPWLFRMAPAVGLAALALPFVYVALSPAIMWAATKIATVPFLARGQSVAELADGSSRAIFWDTAIAYWPRHGDLGAHLFGYGFNGHEQSGVVYLYYTSGGFVNSATALTLHNSLLQQLYDTGYVGLAALTAAFVIVAVRVTRFGHLPTCALLAVLFVTSSIEVFLDPAFRAAPLLMVIALSVVVIPSSRRPLPDDAVALERVDERVDELR